MATVPREEQPANHRCKRLIPQWSCFSADASTDLSPRFKIIISNTPRPGQNEPDFDDDRCIGPALDGQPRAQSVDCRPPVERVDPR